MLSLLIFLITVVILAFFANAHTSNKKATALNKHNNALKKYRAKKQENDFWYSKFNELMAFRDKAKQQEGLNDLNRAIDLYHQAYSFGEATNELNYKNYAHDIERIIVLLGKTKRKDELATFLNKLLEKYPNETESTKWMVRLSKLRPTTTLNQKELTVEDVQDYRPTGDTIGDKVRAFKATLPEFNFYHDMPQGVGTFGHIRISSEQAMVYRRFREGFKAILDHARTEENNNNLKRAIRFI